MINNYLAGGSSLVMKVDTRFIFPLSLSNDDFVGVQVIFLRWWLNNNWRSFNDSPPYLIKHEIVLQNPINPERRYRYKTPVTAVTFSRQTPQLMAVGLYDGSVEVIDITDETSATVGKSQRITSPGLEPVWKIEWINGIISSRKLH